MDCIGNMKPTDSPLVSVSRNRHFSVNKKRRHFYEHFGFQMSIGCSSSSFCFINPSSIFKFESISTQQQHFYAGKASNLKSSENHSTNPMDSSSSSSSATDYEDEEEQKKRRRRTTKKKKKTKAVVVVVRKRVSKQSQQTEEMGTVGCLVEDIEDFSNEKTLEEIRVSLLQWYDQNQRVLPWRKRSTTTATTITNSQENGGKAASDEEEEEDSRKAYAVWVSEVMLQQTRVATVIDYYNRWMEKWPTIHHLACASQEEVNEMWAGLGYYRRARFLLEGAKMVVGGGGEFPRTVTTLRKVRGIGEYTAGAIASIAFNEAVPVVDGNVVRVIARLKAISANPKESETIKCFWKLAGQLVDPLRPGDFNQALMELGAVICTPTSPGCSVCPVSNQCRVLALSRKLQTVQVTDYPTKVIKPKPRHDFCAVCVVEILDNHKDSDHQKEDCMNNNRFLLVKRPEEGLLAGLWEFPSVLLDDGEADLTLRRKTADQFLKKSFKLDIKKCNIISREDVGECIHIFSHIRLRMYVELLILNPKGGAKILSCKEDNDTNLTWKCVDNKSIQSLGLTSGVRKVYNMIQKFKQNNSPINPKSRKRKPA